MCSGRLHPLLEAKGGGGHYILTPNKVPVTGSMPDDGGARFVRLPPTEIESASLRVAQLFHDSLLTRGLMTNWAALDDFTGSLSQLDPKNGATAHLVMPNGLVLPFWFDKWEKPFVAHPNLRRLLGLEGEEAADTRYYFDDLQDVTTVALVYLA